MGRNAQRRRAAKGKGAPVHAPAVEKEAAAAPPAYRSRWRPPPLPRGCPGYMTLHEDDSVGPCVRGDRCLGGVHETDRCWGDCAYCGEEEERDPVVQAVFEAARAEFMARFGQSGAAA